MRKYSHALIGPVMTQSRRVGLGLGPFPTPGLTPKKLLPRSQNLGIVAPIGALTEVCVSAPASSQPEEPPVAKGTIPNTRCAFART